MEMPLKRKLGRTLFVVVPLHFRERDNQQEAIHPVAKPVLRRWKMKSEWSSQGVHLSPGFLGLSREICLSWGSNKCPRVTLQVQPLVFYSKRTNIKNRFIDPSKGRRTAVSQWAEVSTGRLVTLRNARNQTSPYTCSAVFNIATSLFSGNRILC